MSNPYIDVDIDNAELREHIMETHGAVNSIDASLSALDTIIDKVDDMFDLISRMSTARSDEDAKRIYSKMNDTDRKAASIMAILQYTRSELYDRRNEWGKDVTERIRESYPIFNDLPEVVSARFRQDGEPHVIRVYPSTAAAEEDTGANDACH